MISIKMYYISKSIKRIETIACRKVLNHLLAFDQESKRKLLSLISAHSIKNYNVSDLGLKRLLLISKCKVF